MSDPTHDFDRDIARIQSIEQVPLILDVCARTTGMRFVAIARVTEDRWITCASRDDLAFGLGPGDELEVQTTICNEIRAGGTLVTIDDVSRDADFHDHAVPAQYGFKSYISVPIVRADGAFFGTLCAIDADPREVSSEATVGTFRLFADLVARELDSLEELERSRLALLDERKTAELREQFIAIVGHDLRNPIASLSSGLRMMGRSDLDETTEALRQEMQHSVQRMNGIVHNLMDFARGRLGGGIEAEIDPDADLGAAIETVAAEMEAVDGFSVVRKLDLRRQVPCDPQRIGQLVSNLLSNAAVHGRPQEPVTVEADTERDRLRIAVSNMGEPIPEALLPTLFEPFHRAADTTNRAGVGLGLYIASEIARAHGGTLTAQSTDEITTFIFTMPLPSGAEAP